MKFLVRLFLLGIGLYIMLSLGLIEVFVVLLMQIGKVIITLVELNPVATLIGIMLLILMGGVNIIRHDNK